jgi:hypothetical protein
MAIPGHWFGTQVLCTDIQDVNKGFKFGVLHENYVTGTWKTPQHLDSKGF